MALLKYYIDAVMIGRWRHCLCEAMLTRWCNCLNAVMITRWLHSLSVFSENCMRLYVAILAVDSKLSFWTA